MRPFQATRRRLKYLTLTLLSGNRSRHSRCRVVKKHTGEIGMNKLALCLSNRVTQYSSIHGTEFNLNFIGNYINVHKISSRNKLKKIVINKCTLAGALG